MRKKYFFMSGLPRSGNTLLSSLLSQNPKVKVSGFSVVSDIFLNINNIKYTDKYRNIPDENSLDNVLYSILDNYYKDWDCEYIIDRGYWGGIEELNLLKKYLGQEIKIISPVRDFLEVMSSMLIQYNHVLENDLKNHINSGKRFHSYYADDIEYKCDLLMEYDGIMERSVFNVKNLSLEKNKDIVQFVEYNDLVEDTQNQLNLIYDFLDIERYDGHNFSNIEEFLHNDIPYNDEYKEVPNLHSVKSQIQKSNTSIEILSERVKQKYYNFNFWRT
jgi:sulfotransferase